MDSINRSAFFIEPTTYPRPLQFAGLEVKDRASCNNTRGYEIFLQDGVEGSGAPPHHHPWDESFYVVRGDVQFGFGDEEHVARAGTLVHLPAGTVHWFRLGEGGAQMISI